MTEAGWQRLDALDHRIVEKLARDARISNRAIAAELGVTEGTIRTRIKRLQNEGLIQFTVVQPRRHLVRERSQHHVGFAEAPPPGTELDSAQPQLALRGHFTLKTRVDFGHKNPCPVQT